MPGFDIGNVVSPQVAAALLRRGERANEFTRVKRDPTITRRERGQSASDELALSREERLAELQEAQIGAGKRAEGFAREQFDASREDKEREFEGRDSDRALKALTAGMKGRQTPAQQRKVGSALISDIAGMLSDSRKPSRETGQVDQGSVKRAEQAALALFQQWSQGQSPEAVAAMTAQLRRILPQMPASRAAPGISRGGQPQEATKPEFSAQQVAGGAQRENPDPPGEEILKALEQSGMLTRIPSGAQIHNDGSMTLPDGQRVPISEQYLSREGAAAPKVESGLARQLSRSPRTP